MPRGIIEYAPGPDGGVTLSLSGPDLALSLPMDRTRALATAASILNAAGVRRTSFEDGCLTVPDEQ